MSTRRLLPIAIVALLVLTAAASATEGGYPPRTLVLFVADWCAPCHGEVAWLDEIAQAAPGWRIGVADGDSPRRPGRLVRAVATERRWVPDATTTARLRRELFPDMAGLPYSVAFDGAGRVCAESRRPLDAARVAAMLATCPVP